MITRLPEGVWQLPGPRRLVGRIVDALCRGSSCVVYVPRTPELPMFRSEVRDKAQARWIELDLLAALNRTVKVPDALVEVAVQLGATVESRRTPGDLLTHPAIAGTLVWADARWLEGAALERWWDVLRAWASATKELPSTARPTFMTVAHPSARSLAPSDLTIEQYEWFGVIDRLDTAVHLHEKLGEAQMTLEPLAFSLLVEAGGADLDFIDSVVDAQWDGSAAALEKALGARANELGCAASPVDDSWLGTRVDSLSSLDAAKLERWMEGALEAWPRGELWLPGAHVGRVCGRGQLQWSSQVSVMFPLIEQVRQRLARWAGDDANVRELYDTQQLLAMEVTDLAAAVATRVRQRFGQHADLLFWLKRTRHALAHQKPVNEDEMRRGLALIQRCAI